MSESVLLSTHYPKKTPVTSLKIPEIENIIKMDLRIIDGDRDEPGVGIAQYCSAGLWSG
jgi:hypothetical protein